MHNLQKYRYAYLKKKKKNLLTDLELVQENVLIKFFLSLADALDHSFAMLC